MTQRDSKETQEFVHRRLFEYNDVLKSEVQHYRALYGDLIRLAEEMLTYVPQPNDLAIDCFHANKDAQGLISNMTWDSSWWSR
ncbi:MAG: hypothetical protein H7326_06885 [Bdellovibrionaceae bacterium]|nr:hypothetical protein [Pseudobdellovibrionaceae bacterium]